MPGKWYLTSFEEWACREAYHIVIQTDTPCHLWLRWTNRPPWKHPRTRVLRGLNIEGDVYFCFAAYTDVEQDEPGDTLEHTFTISPLARFMVIYFYFFGEIAGETSPSNSPIFARYIDYEAGYTTSTITHEDDAAVISHNEVVSFPPSTPAFNTVGRLGPATDKLGGAFRFRNVSLPRCAEILSSLMVVTAAFNYAKTPVHSRVSAELSGNADDFNSITTAQFWARYATRTGITDWDNMVEWVFGVQYESPSLVSPIQAVVSGAGWESGNALVLFFEDFDQRTPLPSGQVRVCRVYAPPFVSSPVLHVWYNHWQVHEVNVY